MRLTFLPHCYAGESNISELEQLLKVRSFATYNFTKHGKAKSNLKDEEYKVSCRACEKNTVNEAMYSNWCCPDGFRKDSRATNLMYTVP